MQNYDDGIKQTKYTTFHNSPHTLHLGMLPSDWQSVVQS